MRRLLTAVVPLALSLALILPFSPFEGVEGLVDESSAGFETGDFSEFTSQQAKAGGSLEVIGDRAYDGGKAARAAWSGGPEGAQRVWQRTDWGTGSEVWYGVAVFVPRSTNYCYWNPIRWDNYEVYGGTDDHKPGEGDVGGLTIQVGQLSIMRNSYGGREQTLVRGGPVPRDRWAWLEVHQVFSDNDGQALSELYVDGEKRGSSREANSAGRRITDLRAGAVAISTDCASPGSIDFDRVTISNKRIGPLPPGRRGPD